jgi:GNAT superfamily N-acetyltransferase
MDDDTLRQRLWLAFARLQSLLGHHSMQGAVLERPGVVASVVPAAPDSPTLNAAVALNPEQATESLGELSERWAYAGVRRWGVWLDPAARAAVRHLQRSGLIMTASAPGMGVALDAIWIPERNGSVPAADLATVGRVNDMAYGNVDGRLERTLTPLPPGILHGYQARFGGEPAAVALALHLEQDCGISFVATTPSARRRGLATQVMHEALGVARAAGLTTTTLQATEAGERLYRSLGYRRLCDMQLWERRR